MSVTNNDTLVVLITGANQGLGFHAAVHLSKQAHLYLFVSGRNAERVHEAVDKIVNEEGCKARVEALVLDVTNDESVEAALEVIRKSAGRLDVLVNNSAVAITRTPTMTPRALRKAYVDLYAVNVFGSAALAEAALPLLILSARPSIVNVSSGLGSCGLLADPNAPKDVIDRTQPYATSKSALNQLTVCLARSNPGIHCVSVCPGHNATNLNNYRGKMDPKDGAKVIVAHVLERKGKSPGFYTHEDKEYPW